MSLKSSEEIQKQEELLSIILNDISKVSDMLEGKIGPNHFDEKYTPLLYAIFHSNNQNVLLTKNSFVSFINKSYDIGDYKAWTGISPGKPSAISSQLQLFTRIKHLTKYDPNNFPFLIEYIRDILLKHRCIECIETFNIKQKVNFKDSLRHLSDNISVALNEYENNDILNWCPIDEISEDWYKNCLYRINHPEEKIICEIKEIDDSMSTGFGPGTLTLFVADVGGFKCQSENELVPIDTGEYITAKELFERFNSGEKQIKLLSLNFDDKIYKQKINKVIDNGKQDCYKLTTISGQFSVMTGNHPYLTRYGYVELSKLSIGDEVGISRVGVFGNKNISKNNIIYLSNILLDKHFLDDTKININDIELCKSFIDNIYASNQHLNRKVFTWDKKSISLLLSFLFDRKGEYICPICDKTSDTMYIIYVSYSHSMVVDIRNLLLKFGIISHIYDTTSYYILEDISIKGEPPYSLCINGKNECIKFMKEIGNINKSHNDNCLFHENLICNENIKSDIYWDKVKSIENVGKIQTYNISMSVDYNFVANNFITHNSSMMINIALNIFKNQKKNILFCSLEMPKDMVLQRIVSRQTKISLQKLNNPSLLSEEDKEKIKKEIDTWKEYSYKFVILDNEERSTVSSIRKEIERNVAFFKPDIVIIDYISILKPEHSYSRMPEYSWYGHMCKDLRQMGRKFGFATISAAQLGRDAIKRLRGQKEGNQTVGSDDLRGSHDYSADADNIYAIVPCPSEPNKRLQLFCIKSRNGSKTFNGKNSCLLDVYPEICYISSNSDLLISSFNSEEDILMKKLAEKPPIITDGPNTDFDIDKPIHPIIDSSTKINDYDLFGDKKSKKTNDNWDADFK